jgi:prepilin-type N-terminal cleavage/methylation domain-containing protein
MKVVKDARLGFTLIELLVVIAIIAILAAILFPVF